MIDKSLLALILVALPSAGCATLVHGTSQRIEVATEPPGAAVVVPCAGLETAHTEPTPTTVVLRRRASACALELSKPGYSPVTVELTEKISSALALGNLVTCGCGLAVDAVTGGLLAFAPGSVEVTLQPGSVEADPPLGEVRRALGLPGTLVSCELSRSSQRPTLPGRTGRRSRPLARRRGKGVPMERSPRPRRDGTGCAAVRGLRLGPAGGFEKESYNA